MHSVRIYYAKVSREAILFCRKDTLDAALSGGEMDTEAGHSVAELAKIDNFKV